MSLKIDHEAMLQTVFDSGALTPLCTLIHVFNDPGLYLGEVLRGEEVVGTFLLQAVQEGQPKQVNVDLSSLRRTTTEPYLIQTPGAAIFYVSTGLAGHAVVVRRAEGGNREIVFDSRQLGPDDFFTVTLLQPGDYELLDQAGKAQRRLRVKKATPSKARYRPPAHAFLDAKAKQPSEVREFDQAQTQVFRPGRRSRIKVRLLEDSPEPQDKKKYWPKRSRRPWR